MTTLGDSRNNNTQTETQDTSESNLFLHTIKENYLFQHVNNNTRVRRVKTIRSEGLHKAK